MKPTHYGVLLKLHYEVMSILSYLNFFSFLADDTKENIYMASRHSSNSLNKCIACRRGMKVLSLKKKVNYEL